MKQLKTLARLTLAVAAVALTACACNAHNTGSASRNESPTPAPSVTTDRTEATVVVGAARTDRYVPLLRGKRIALLSNQTGMVGDRHVLDIMLANGLNVTTIFSPEHGFRGTADAGEHVSSTVDEKTGIPIASLYDGKSPMPSI